MSEQSLPGAGVIRKSFPVSDVTAVSAFTNRISSLPGSHSGYSVILIDHLFADFGDPLTQEEGSGGARLQTLRMQRSMPVGEKIAIYGKGRNLRVICCRQSILAGWY
jgi:hypothetical protein